MFQLEEVWITHTIPGWWFLIPRFLRFFLTVYMFIQKFILILRRILKTIKY